MPSDLLIFQRLSVEWGEAGRSALLTARRRELPKSYPLPLSPVPAGVVALAQNVEWTDADGFAHAHETLHEYGHLANLHPAEVEVAPSEGNNVDLLPTPMLGIPGVSGRVRLRLGQLARFEWNEHLGGGRVRHTVLNVTLSPRIMQGDVFNRMPDLYHSHCIDLNQRRLKAWRTG